MSFLCDHVSGLSDTCWRKNSYREKQEVGIDSISFQKSVSLLFPKTVSFWGVHSLLPQLGSTELQTAALGQDSTFAGLGNSCCWTPKSEGNVEGFSIFLGDVVLSKLVLLLFLTEL